MLPEKKYDLIVIGGGVLGAFSAFHALLLGKSVALLERNKRPRQATVRNFGQIVPSGLSTDWRKYGLKSLEIYRELQAIRDFSLRQNGTAYVASDEDEVLLLHEMNDIDRQMGYSSQLLDQRAACARFDGLKTSYCREALFYPEEYSCDPRQMIGCVIDYLVEQADLQYFPNTVAQDIEMDRGRTCKVISNRKEIFWSDQILICNGAEYQLLFPELYEDEALECSKLQMMMTKPQKNRKILGNILSGLSIRRYESFRECPSYTNVQSRYVQHELVRDWGIHILFKQADNGQVIIGDSHHYADAVDKDELGFDILQEVNDFMMLRAKEIFNLDTWDLDRIWTGVYSQCKGRDVLTRTIENKIHILNAIGGKGMTAGPGYTFYHINKLFGND